MTNKPSSTRCRLALISPEGEASTILPLLKAAISGGDIGCLIVPQYGMDEVAFQNVAEALTPVAQEAGIAVMIAGDSRVAGRVKADGVHVDGKTDALDAIERLQSKIAVGVGGAKTRDDALELGEMRPDYIFFGRFGYDAKPDAHPRNLALGSWWAEMIDVPCIVMAGSTLEFIGVVAATGAEFVAVSAAIFSAADPAEAVAAANALLDAHSPKPGSAA